MLRASASPKGEDPFDKAHTLLVDHRPLRRSQAPKKQTGSDREHCLSAIYAEHRASCAAPVCFEARREVERSETKSWGVVSFGYFSLDKQRKVPRLSHIVAGEKNSKNKIAIAMQIRKQHVTLKKARHSHN